MLIIGHRGAMGYEPENTLRSFQKAIDQGVDMIEFDVQTTKDGELVVMHDYLLEHATTGKGFIYQKTLAEIKEADAGLGEKVPTLQETLDFIDRRVPVVVELKGMLPSAHLTAKVLKEYLTKKGWSHEDFMVCSFIHSELMLLQKELPQIKTIVNQFGIPVDYGNFADDIGADAITNDRFYINEAYVHDAHERGKMIFAVGVDFPEDGERFRQMGVDGVFSNTPDRIHPDYLQQKG